jgi:hypothetical protein
MPILSTAAIKRPNFGCQIWFSALYWTAAEGSDHCLPSGVEFKNDEASFYSPTHINGEKQRNSTLSVLTF